ncbi:unnamed protein product [Angiostrongylus costaricensis]|uniref:DUF5348 domain-containing protein n=1 Tax=Angiostrongylus costaricensis TaxID=334426 RepID=A0A0R3PY41_ANGCS|nr:unnamed protein product [Angiostrongylus costaricensis]
MRKDVARTEISCMRREFERGAKHTIPKIDGMGDDMEFEYIGNARYLIQAQLDDLDGWLPIMRLTDEL